MISVIIPTWNEALELPQTLLHLATNNVSHETILVDAGSTDDTVEIGVRSGACIISSPVRQRAFQLNLAVAAAEGETLLFLHADTWLNPCSLSAIEESLRMTDVAGGGFVRCFRSPSLFLAMTTRLAQIRNHCIGWHLGDQAIFARRTAFQQLRGFRLMSQFKDLDFSRRLRQLGQTVTLGPPVLSSARRFAGGPVRHSLADLLLTMRFVISTSRHAEP